MSKKEPILIIISAPSGGGKTTLCQRLLQDFPNQVRLSISSTTRAPRGQEKHGKEYFFMNEKDFKMKIDQNGFAEWAVVHGHYYGTSKATIKTSFDLGHSVLLDVDVQGANSLRESFPNRHVSVFIAPPNIDALANRLRSRGTESEEKIQQRIRNAKDEMKHLNTFDHVIVNDDLDHAYGELKAIVEEKLSK